MAPTEEEVAQLKADADLLMARWRDLESAATRAREREDAAYTVANAAAVKYYTADAALKRQQREGAANAE